MIQSTTFIQTLMKKMNDSTWLHYLEKTLKEIEDHPHREELIKLINEQIADDTNEVLPFAVYWLSLKGNPQSGFLFWGTHTPLLFA